MSSDLEIALRDLGQDLAWADGGDLVASVRARITGAPAVEGVRRHRRFVAAALAVVALVVGSAVGPVRTAVADLLGLGIVEVKVVDALPEGLSAVTRFGRPVTVAEARQAVGFVPRLPAALGPPDAAYTGSPPGGVSFVWEEAGVLVTEHPGEVAGVVKTVVVRSGTEPVLADGELGLWLTGPHAVSFVAADGETVTDDPRLADNTLVWSRDGVIVRIETDGDLDEALAIAASMPP
jgi:hypothetical protein